VVWSVKNALSSVRPCCFALSSVPKGSPGLELEGMNPYGNSTLPANPCRTLPRVSLRLCNLIQSSRVHGTELYALIYAHALLDRSIILAKQVIGGGVAGAIPSARGGHGVAAQRKIDEVCSQRPPDCRDDWGSLGGSLQRGRGPKGYVLPEFKVPHARHVLFLGVRFLSPISSDEP
jgi:hypothetical protein